MIEIIKIKVKCMITKVQGRIRNLVQKHNLIINNWMKSSLSSKLVRRIDTCKIEINRLMNRRALLNHLGPKKRLLRQMSKP